MELKPVTVLSAELPGFIEISGTLPAKEFNVLLSEIHQIAETTIRLHHGVLTHFSGDSFQVLFSSVKSSTDTAVLATETLVEFRERLGTHFHREKLPVQIGFKAGIAKGEATVGEIDSGGKKQTTVMGKAVNFSGRLKAFADTGQILVNDVVYRAVNKNFEFNKLEPLPVRGSKETLAVYELLGRKRKKAIHETGPERKIGSEMVGRGHEMDLIEGSVKKLLSGKGSVVNVVGKAGIGKSRLISELKAQDWLDKATVLEGRAQSMGRNLSFHPIIQLIRSWSDIREEDSPAKSANKLHDSIQRVAHEQAEEIFPFIATMMGLPLTGKYKERIAGIEGEALEKLILKNLRDLVTLTSRVRPLVIILEDLHWADNSSILFLESLLKLSSHHPVLFINIFRPGFEETGDYLLHFLKENLSDNHSTILIEPLVKSDSEDLIGNLLHKASLPVEIVELILRKTEGNPFFIEEVIRSFIDEGIVTIEGNAFKVTEKIHQVNIPESINEVILSRVDKLDEKTRELLKTASVIGRNFYYKVLEEAADTIGEIDDRLEYLKEVQLISESKKKEEIEYLFKHALAQQAMYESILLNSKKELHLKIARSIEKVFAGNLNEFYGTLAYHYEMAETREKTEEYLVLAGDEAMKSGASKEAIHYYNKALSLIEHPESDEEAQKVFELEEKKAYAHYALGQNIRASQHFIKVANSYGFAKVPTNSFSFSLKVMFSFAKLFFKLLLVKRDNACDVTGDDERKMKLLVYLGEAMVSFDPRKGTFYSIILGMGEPLKLLTNTNYGIAFLLNLNITFHWSGRALWFGKLLNQYLTSYIHKDNNFVYLAYLYYLSISSYLTGKLLIDTSEDKSIFEYGMYKGRVWAATTHHAFKGIGYVELGKEQNAIQLIENLHTISTELEHSFSLAQYYRLKITYLLKYRKLDELLSEAEKVIEIIGKTDHSSILVIANNIISIAYSLKNNLAKAREHHEIATDLSKKLWLKYYLSMTSLAGVYLHMAQMKVNKHSKSDASEFLRITQNLVSVSKTVHCNKTEAYRLRAIAFSFYGNHKAALSSFVRSIKFAQWYGARVELSRTYFELGKFLSDPKSGKKQLNELSGQDYLEKARSMFEEMNLQWDLQEYEQMIKSR